MYPALQTITFDTITGQQSSLADYAGKVVLIVNVASKCGLTAQYEELVKLYDQYKDRGFTILGFPANNFLGQEPGTNQDIATFCSATYGVDFPMAAKISVKGDDIHPLYSALITAQPHAVRNPDSDFEKLLHDKGLISGQENDIQWNFEKFLISEQGEVISRFAPDITPLDERITQAIESALIDE
ncbi:glutathione peroxidase [Celerinatantimonas sp. YJH-8]|uniref:glutathione peroxidase n=1 Tax=Celerinatantimonas sp. YJH-8 TaxID=3228714 RepID=UPI0038BE4540